MGMVGFLEVLLYILFGIFCIVLVGSCICLIMNNVDE